MTHKALKAALRKEDGLAQRDAHQRAYRILRARWLEWLRPDEREAYWKDVRASQAIADPELRKAFWAQPAQEGRAE